MKKTLLIIICALMITGITAQTINFDNVEVLFDHPREEDTGLNYPFIPFDYNADGHTDFIGSTFNDQIVYKGGDGVTFDALPINLWSHRPLKIMDWDNDGDEDVIFEGSIVLYIEEDSFALINPSISFQKKIIEVADFNNDGHYDLLTTKEITFEDDELSIEYNNGENEFTSEIIQNDAEYGIVAIGDVDNDGTIDITYQIRGSSSTVNILFNRNNTFEKQTIALQAELRNINLKLFDIDQDGDLDILTSGRTSKILIAENVNGFESFNIIEIPQGGIFYYNIADMNNDGIMDFVILTRPSGFQIEVLESIGILEYVSAYEGPMFEDSDFFGYPNLNFVPNNMPLYDVDKDGRIDIVYIDGFGEPNQVKWLRNTTEITSTEDEELVREITISPNPAKDIITISTEEFVQSFDYEVFTLDGKQVMNGISIQGMIDISSLESGVYIISSSTLGMSQRFVKVN